MAEFQRRVVCMTKFAGIFGHPLTHSVSPAFQQAAFDSVKLDVVYLPWSVKPADFDQEIQKLRGDKYIGCNITIPYKERVVSFLDSLDPAAQMIGSVNTIVKIGQTLIGHNTDADGFIRALKTEGDFDPVGAKIVLLGAGGAARAAAFGLALAGAGSISIVNRTVSRAESIVLDITHILSDLSALSFRSDLLTMTCLDADLIVNCTSMGMKGGSDPQTSPLNVSHISPETLVFDMVYNPSDTPLIAEARKAGAKTVGGLSMLVYQGAESFQLWTGIRPPMGVMMSAADIALGS